MKTKTCPKCKIKKSLSEFHKIKSRAKDPKKIRNPDIRQTYCKVCQKKARVKKRKDLAKLQPVVKVVSKVCSKCKIEKPLNEFYKRKTRAKNSKKTPKRVQRSSQCKVCCRLNAKQKQKGRRTRYLKQYGITIEDYEKLLKEQNGCCAICGLDKPSVARTCVKHFSVDHNHTTGEMRGLLCDRCNRGLGFFQDNSEMLLKACQYLLTHEEKQ